MKPSCGSALPDTITLSTEDGDKTAKLSYSDTNLSKVKLDKSGEYKISATIDYEGINLDANGYTQA